MSRIVLEWIQVMVFALYVLREIWMPLSILFIACLLRILGTMDIIYTEERMLHTIEHFFVTYGVWSIAVVAALENVVAFNLYFPGSVVILIGMGTTSGDPVLAVKMFFAITIPSQIVQVGNFFAGRWMSTPNDGIRLSSREFWIAYFHPQSASIASLKAGKEGWLTRRFLGSMIVAAISWHVFWAMVMYYGGGGHQGRGNWIAFIFYAYIVIWIVQGVISATRKRSHSVK